MRCRPETITPGRIWIDQLRIEINPVYQREAGVWSVEKKQLFIDSLFNGFDIPKLYLNVYPPDHPYLYAIVDGKQRLTTIISFMKDEFSLADDFVYSGPDDLDGAEAPLGGCKFSELSDRAKEIFKGVPMAVTKTDDASEEDIEALFARLNNGEPLNSAESRNAIGGDMAALVREIAGRSFFTNKIRFANTRFAYYEVACKLLFIESTRVWNGMNSCPELKKKYLDSFVRDNRTLLPQRKAQLVSAIDAQLRELERCFDNDSPELSKQSYPQFFYLWIRELLDLYAAPNLHSEIRAFLPEFTLLRSQNNEKPEELRDPTLVEYGRLTQQGTNDAGSMTRRGEIMTRYFLLSRPQVAFKDQRRAYTPEERYVIWLRAGKKCQACNLDLPELSMMDADHVQRHADGGQTKMENARSLCINCNRNGRN